MITALDSLSVFKILVVFYSVDVVYCVVEFWRFMENKEIGQGVLAVFGIYAVSLIVSVLWGFKGLYGTLTRKTRLGVSS